LNPKTEFLKKIKKFLVIEQKKVGEKALIYTASTINVLEYMAVLTWL